MRLWATWSSWRCPCSLQGGWSRWSCKVLSNPNYSMVLWQALQESFGLSRVKISLTSQSSRIQINPNLIYSLSFVISTSQEYAQMSNLRTQKILKLNYWRAFNKNSLQAFTSNQIFTYPGTETGWHLFAFFSAPLSAEKLTIYSLPQAVLQCREGDQWNTASCNGAHGSFKLRQFAHLHCKSPKGKQFWKDGFRQNYRLKTPRYFELYEN